MISMVTRMSMVGLAAMVTMVSLATMVSLVTMVTMVQVVVTVMPFNKTWTTMDDHGPVPMDVHGYPW